MLPPELQPGAFRPYISASASAPSFSPSSGLNHQNPNFSTTTASTFSRRSSSSSSAAAAAGPDRSRYSRPSSFVHNGRIAVTLVPCAAFLLDLGGAPVVAALTFGLMFAYILDSLSFKAGSFFAIWFSLISAQLAFFFSSSIFITFPSFTLSLVASFLCALTNFLIGVWVSLQFKWIQIEYPTVVLALERLLFACLPVIASSIFTWATVSAIGMANAAYYFMTFNCLFYWLYSIPRISSFKSKRQVGYHGGEVPDDNLILGQLESCVHTLHLVVFPVLFHVASHYPIMFSSWAAICDLLLLFFVPFMFQLYASTRGALWWLTKNDHQVHSIRMVNGAVALVLVIISLEVRVVFHSFGRYIQVPPPLNYLLVTTTMLGGAAAAGAYALGMISNAFGSMAFTALAVVVSAAGAIVVGFPILVCIIVFPSLVSFTDLSL